VIFSLRILEISHQNLHTTPSLYLRNSHAQIIASVRGRNPCLCTHSLRVHDLSLTSPNHNLKFSTERLSDHELGKLKSNHASNVKEKMKPQKDNAPHRYIISWYKDMHLSHFYLSINTVTSRLSTICKSQSEACFKKSTF